MKKHLIRLCAMSIYINDNEANYAYYHVNMCLRDCNIELVKCSQGRRERISVKKFLWSLFLATHWELTSKSLYAEFVFMMKKKTLTSTQIWEKESLFLKRKSNSFIISMSRVNYSKSKKLFTGQKIINFCLKYN